MRERVSEVIAIPEAAWIIPKAPVNNAIKKSGEIISIPRVRTKSRTALNPKWQHRKTYLVPNRSTIRPPNTNPSIPPSAIRFPIRTIRSSEKPRTSFSNRLKIIGQAPVKSIKRKQ